jgi:hypothetical protein
VPAADAFLDGLLSLLAPDGRLVVALPLPHANVATRHGALPLTATTWEAAADETCAFLERKGLRVLRLVRAPYLSQGVRRSAGVVGGPDGHPFVLDGAVFVCERSAASRAQP